MTLPSAYNPISLGQVQTEFGGSNPISMAEYYRNGLYTTSNNTNVPIGPAGVRIKLSDFYGAVNEILRYITTTSTNVNASSYFTAAEWASSAPKRLVINSGVTVGATNTSNYALNIPSGFGGTFRLDNNGSILGAGGAANSGTGGNAIFAGAPISINNGGIIYSGGGGGGQGGTGGNGSYVGLGAEQFLGSSGWRTFPGYGYDQYGYRCQQACKDAFPQYANVRAVFNVSNPYRDKYCCVACCFGSCCDCCNNDNDQDANASCCYGQPYILIGTSGGAGGSGGRGQGYDGNLAAGPIFGQTNGPLDGGTNAGRGGTGGTGGNWGTSGDNGVIGANGNAGSAPTLGTSGGPTSGGLAGFYIVNNSNVTWIATGTRAGRVG